MDLLIYTALGLLNSSYIYTSFFSVALCASTASTGPPFVAALQLLMSMLWPIE